MGPRRVATGTQRGGTAAQILTLYDLLSEGTRGKVVDVAHGDCIGWDAQAHMVATERGHRVWIFPPEDDRKRAFCEPYYRIMPVAEYKVRDRAMVDWARMSNEPLVIGAPKHEYEELFSGTWVTLRYARKRQVPFRIILPSGDVTDQWPRESVR